MGAGYALRAEPTPSSSADLTERGVASTQRTSARPRTPVDTDRWPTFTPEAIAAGFGSVIALPLRRRGSTLGALNLFRHAEGALPDDDIAAAQAFADIATIGLLNRKVANDAATVNKQLNEALTSRVVIEQAKGMVAERTATSVDLAFDRLRKHARRRNRLLADVARDIVDGTLSPLDLDAV